jgi:hypothetical protein
LKSGTVFLTAPAGATWPAFSFLGSGSDEGKMIRPAYMISEEQFAKNLSAAGPGATLGISRVNPKNPKNRASETPSRSLGTPHDVPPARHPKDIPATMKVNL